MKIPGLTAGRLYGLGWFLVLGGAAVPAVNLIFCWSRYQQGLWAAVNWHRGFDSLADYYRKSMHFYLLLSLVLFLMRRKLKGYCLKALSWLHEPSHPRARKIIFGAFVFFAATHALKLHWGFWFPSIGGWTYAKDGPRLRASPAPMKNPLGFRPATPADHPYLEKAVLSENAAHIRQEGYLTGSAVFLHFSGGEVLPASQDLLGLVFPRYVFRNRTMAQARVGSYLAMVRRTLEQRREGLRFLLPLGLAYPPHTPYMALDYKGYPEASKLEKITAWDLSTRLDGQGGVSVVSAVLAASWED